MSRRIGWFSSGAASAVAVKLAKPDLIVYCDTGAEDIDNHRFRLACELWFDQDVEVIQSEKYKSTWEVWEGEKYISGIKGAPCTRLLKIQPRLDMQRPDDIHIFGYTADSDDVRRARNLKENWPELNVVYPLIDHGLNKAACLAMIESAGIQPPRVYGKGFRNANCIPCCKATSPDYWSLVRQEYPEEFNRMVELSRRLDVRLTRLNDERVFIDEIPEDWPTSEPLAPACDFLCQLAEEEIGI